MKKFFKFSVLILVSGIILMSSILGFTAFAEEEDDVPWLSMQPIDTTYDSSADTLQMKK